MPHLQAARKPTSGDPKYPAPLWREVRAGTKGASMAKSYFFVLGSRDVEMSLIEELLWSRASYGHALGKDGNRVAPGDPGWGFVPMLGYVEDGMILVMVECNPPPVWDGIAHEVLVIDHHAPHPNSTRPPEEYWEASSLGQVCDLLDIKPTHELLAQAAADHCLAAAFAGQCPGVDMSLGGLQYRLVVDSRRRVFAPAMTPADFRKAIDTARQTLLAAPPALDLDPSGMVGDLADLPLDGHPAHGTGEVYSSQFQFGPLVGAITGRGYVARVLRSDRRIGWRVGGVRRGDCRRGRTYCPMDEWGGGISRVPARGPQRRSRWHLRISRPGIRGRDGGLRFRFCACSSVG